MEDKEIKELVKKGIEDEARIIEENTKAFSKANPAIEEELDKRCAEESERMWDDLQRRIKEREENKL